MSAFVKFQVYVLFGSLLFYGGCSRPIVHLWSDHSELAVMAELYNATQDDTLVLFHLDDNPALLLRNSDTRVDVLVSDDLHHESYADHFISLQNTPGAEALYPSMRDVYGAHLLPLAFDLPLMLFESNGDAPRFGVSEQELVSRSGSEAEEQMRYFSPLWDSEFLVYVLRLRGIRFFEGQNDIIRWDSERIQQVAESLRTWTQGIAPIETQDRFIEKTFTAPPHRIIQLGRIGAHWSTAALFFSQYPFDRAGIRPAWLQNETGILVTRSLAAGVVRASSKKQQAKRFITWLIDPATQEFYLANKERMGIASFGFIGGFSSVYTINEGAIQNELDDLRMPLPSEIQFSLPHVRDWARYSQHVVQPWILSYVRSADAESGDEPLVSATQKWINQIIR